MTRTRQPRWDRQTCLRPNRVWLVRAAGMRHTHGAAQPTCMYVNTLATPLFRSGNDVCRSVFGAKQLILPPLLHTHRQRATPPVPIFDSHGEHLKFPQISVFYRDLCGAVRFVGAVLWVFLFIFACFAAPAACDGRACAAHDTPPPTRHLHVPQTRRKRELFRVVRTYNGALKCCGLRRRRLRHHAWHGAYWYRYQCRHCTVSARHHGGRWQLGRQVGDTTSSCATIARYGMCYGWWTRVGIVRPGLTHPPHPTLAQNCQVGQLRPQVPPELLAIYRYCRVHKVSDHHDHCTCHSICRRCVTHRSRWQRRVSVLTRDDGGAGRAMQVRCVPNCT